jgi:hypothetical protein
MDLRGPPERQAPRIHPGAMPADICSEPQPPHGLIAESLDYRVRHGG